MSAPQKFRTAFNGFNREDVASYLEYLNAKHTAQVNQLTSEADFLRSRLESARPAEDPSETVAALEQERDELRAQLEELQARYDALAAEKAAAPAVAAVPDSELEIYRRAERTERMARERADLVYRQTSNILTEASVRVSDMSEKVVPIADDILAQINQLQSTVSATRQSLQEAVVILNTLRSDNN